MLVRKKRSIEIGKGTKIIEGLRELCKKTQGWGVRVCQKGTGRGKGNQLKDLPEDFLLGSIVYWGEWGARQKTVPVGEKKKSKSSSWPADRDGIRLY